MAADRFIATHDGIQGGKMDEKLTIKWFLRTAGEWTAKGKPLNMAWVRKTFGTPSEQQFQHARQILPLHVCQDDAVMTTWEALQVVYTLWPWMFDGTEAEPSDEQKSEPDETPEPYAHIPSARWEDAWTQINRLAKIWRQHPEAEQMFDDQRRVIPEKVADIIEDENLHVAKFLNDDLVKLADAIVANGEPVDPRSYTGVVAKAVSLLETYRAEPKLMYALARTVENHPLNEHSMFEDGRPIASRVIASAIEQLEEARASRRAKVEEAVQQHVDDGVAVERADAITNLAAELFVAISGRPRSKSDMDTFDEVAKRIRSWDFLLHDPPWLGDLDDDWTIDSDGRLIVKKGPNNEED
jgi:hypothetical protein